MVFLSERKSSLIEKNKENLTLLNNDLKTDLEDLNMLLEKKQKENIVPFGIQSKGHDINYHVPESPGPGAYNLDSHKKPFNSGSNSFIFKSPRFKDINQESNNIPGPGSYNIANNKPIISKNIIHQRPFSEVSFQYNTNSLNNVASIPAKNQNFGYFVDENGELIKAVDPALDLYFSGTKSNSIGPDRYNPIIKEKNHCISWNKMSGRKPKIINNHSNNNSIKGEISLNSSKISLVDTDISSSIRSPKERSKSINRKKSYSEIIRDNNNKRLFSSNNYKEDDIPIDTQKELEFLNHENDIILGKNKRRNYYLNFNKIRYAGRPEEFQFFLSSNERKTGQSLILSEFPNIGPGSYFRDTYKKLNNIKNNKNKQNDWGKNVGRDDIHPLKRSSSNLGPGAYNIMKNFEKKSFNSYGSFSSEKRFDLSYLPENNLTINENNNNVGNPGPGSYNYNDPWIKDASKMIKRPTLVNVEEEIRKANLKKNKEKKPDFNIYQNDKYINVIQNNIRNKLNPFTSEHMPFLSGSKRFKLSKSNSTEDLGPGRYDLYKNEDSKNKKFGTIVAPFSTNAEKKPTYLGKPNNDLAPGQYRLDSYFDWNKKSFNAMFI